MRVLVLDACQRAALACVRSLGQDGFEVFAGDEVAKTLAGASRYALDSIVYPSPYLKPAEFVEWARQAFSELQLDAVLPVTEVTTDLIVRNREYWPDLTIPFADIEKIDKLSNKVELFRTAESLGIPVPRSIVVDDAGALRRAAETMGFPGVLKPARSRVLVDNEWKGTTVRQVGCTEDLEQLIDSLPSYYYPALFQEFVPGKGSGIFAIYRNSTRRAYFAHNRLREKPPEGGVSVLSESRIPNQELLECSTRLLDAAAWEGVAMVEYRVSDERGVYLMEVNARLWGSLQLAIDAGVDFPALLLEDLSQAGLALPEYREGVRLRWFLGDLDRLYLLFKNWRNVGAATLLKECVTFGLTFFSRAKNETLRLSDPGPGFYELKNYLSSD